MIALATTSDRLDHHGRASSSAGWSTPCSTAGSARKEVGSEIELAANRKPYYDDEMLEGKRLERVQLMGVLLLVVLVIGLPLYWMFEPTRQAGATGGHAEAARRVGRASCSRPTADGGVQLRRVPRRHERHRRRRPPTRSPTR